MFKDIKCIIFTFIIPFLLCSSCILGQGEYPYAERYIIKSNELDLINAINEFINNNHEYIVPPETQLNNGRYKGINQHEYHVFFYYNDENSIIKTWTRPSTLNLNNTTLAFVGINKGLKLGNWKFINKDFSRKENKLQKQKFEERILNPIKEILKEMEKNNNSYD